MNQQKIITVIAALGGLGLLVGGSVFLRGTFRQRAAPDTRVEDTSPKGGTFLRDVSGLPEAKPSAVVELRDGESYNLTATMVRKNIHDRPVKMLAYNGSVPGPLIKVPQGAEVTINFTNNTDVETSLHSHGVRLANEFDGTPGLTQKAVPVGGTFVYKVKFPDAGIFWYHPHVREDYAQELGLSGNYLVTSDDPSFWQPVNQEVPLILDDLLMENGNVAAFDRSVADHALMGRFGNVMLVNGETDYSLNVRQGDVVRFYMTNAASTRTFNVVIPNAKMKLVGADGGKYERETYVENVVVGPSERAIIEALFERPGTYALQHETPEKAYPLGTIHASADVATLSRRSQFSTLRTNQDAIASMDPFRSLFEKAAGRKLTMTIDMMGMENMGAHMMSGSGAHDGEMMENGRMMKNPMMSGSAESIEWEDTNPMMNQMATTRNLQWKMADQETGKSNMDIDWKFNVGDAVKFRIFNDPQSAHPMQHPLHFHGQRFLIVSTNGVKNDNLVWKDTVLVKGGDTVEILVNMSNPGAWMAHCHIAEHLEDGMMFRYTVNP